MNVKQMCSHVAFLCEANEIIISAAPGGRAYSSYWLRGRSSSRRWKTNF
jgi:hypothetical protein